MMHPTDYPQIFGSNFATRNSDAIVKLGDREYTKYDLGAIGCPHTNAARELNKVLKHLRVSDLNDLVARYSPEDFVGVKGFGVTAFYALTCILRDAKVPLSQFYQAKVTVPTLQHHARRPKRARKGQAA